MLCFQRVKRFLFEVFQRRLLCLRSRQVLLAPCFAGLGLQGRGRAARRAFSRRVFDGLDSAPGGESLKAARALEQTGLFPKAAKAGVAGNGAAALGPGSVAAVLASCHCKDTASGEAACCKQPCRKPINVDSSPVLQEAGRQQPSRRFAYC